jgi:hypothetical protein
VADERGSTAFFDIPVPADKPIIIRRAMAVFLMPQPIATIEYRSGRWKPSQIWYVVGLRSPALSTDLPRRAGCVTARLEHIAFGSIWARTKRGGLAPETIGLAELLEEVIDARAMLRKGSPLERQDAEEIAGDWSCAAGMRNCHSTEYRYVFYGTSCFLQRRHTAERYVASTIAATGPKLMLRLLMPKLPEERALGQFAPPGEVVPSGRIARIPRVTFMMAIGFTSL